MVDPDVMIALDGVGKRYPDGTVAVGDLSLDVHRGEVVALVGPSGCGKSTTLRMVNRLVEPTSGRILLDGEDVTATDPVRLRRRIGYVIQRVGLFPHRTVGENVATVPELLGWDRTLVRQRVGELLDLVGLPAATYADRYPHELSGGQQQRVGVARALAADPPVLLLDEPFGAVDPVQRERLQDEFTTIRTRLGTTALFVTHDLDEAVRVADRVAVLGPGGRLDQLADPATLLAAPANDAVAAFVGADAGVRRMAVTPLLAEDLEPAGPLAGGPAAGVPPLRLGASVRDAFTALAARDDARLPVVDETGAVVGVVTPGALHAALRRGAGGSARPVPAGG
ncbi:ABC transporter ATP-binding protein [Kineosporia sp. R_H_3]|uniref:ABC transporter ATP-binding protein n=1 Tax=Kineosporia sp. R_H_3 TaxID=1961848 RepID=UPI001E5760C3|nr:ABC transporter ATP-binding protein [Kineosporia sp. R_H_3]